MGSNYVTLKKVIYRKKFKQCKYYYPNPYGSTRLDECGYFYFKNYKSLK